MNLYNHNINMSTIWYNKQKQGHIKLIPWLGENLQKSNAQCGKNFIFGEKEVNVVTNHFIFIEVKILVV